MMQAVSNTEQFVPPRAKPSAAWMVTFGDLLTLLLCFFLTMVSLGPLAQPEKTETKQMVDSASGTPPTDPESEKNVQIFGTNLATDLDKDHPKEGSSPKILTQPAQLLVSFSGQDFEDEVEPAVTKLRGALRAEALDQQALPNLKIISCGNQNEIQAASRLDFIRAQLETSRAQIGELRFAVDADCAKFTDDKSAQVLLVLEQRTDG